MTGTGIASSAQEHRRRAPRVGEVLLARVVRASSTSTATSAPAENTGPAPCSTTARTDPSAGTLGANAVSSCDHRLVEGVADVRPVERDGGDGAADSMISVDTIAYIRKTPNFASGIGALYAADSPSASASRVRAGSRMPSSHSRAVE